MDKAKFYNPFRPTAGAEPPRIIGRDDISLEFVEGLMSGGWRPPRALCESQARAGREKRFFFAICATERLNWAGRPLLFRPVRVCRTILWSRFKTN